MGTVSEYGLLVSSYFCLFGGVAMFIINSGTGIGIPVLFIGLFSASTARILISQAAKINSLERKLAARDQSPETSG
jgi:NaMN:DMB phosphoribosyltransferase